MVENRFEDNLFSLFSLTYTHTQIHPRTRLFFRVQVYGTYIYECVCLYVVPYRHSLRSAPDGVIATVGFQSGPGSICVTICRPLISDICIIHFIFACQ